MATILIILQLLIVLAMIFIGAKVGGIGLGIYGMVGVFILVFVFGLEPGSIPIDVMLIIVSVITASSALQAAGGMDYMVNLAVRFLKKHPSRITFLAPLVTWLFTHMTGTAHTCYALLPIISEIARKEKVRPERPLSIATIAASLGCTGSPVSAATAAIISEEMLGAKGIGLMDVMMVTVPASIMAILVASLVQNYVGKPLEKDPEYQRRLKEGYLADEAEEDMDPQHANPHARWAVLAFLLGEVLVLLFGIFPTLRPSFDGVPLNMSSIIEMVMMSVAALILLVGKADVRQAMQFLFFFLAHCANLLGYLFLTLVDCVQICLAKFVINGKDVAFRVDGGFCLCIVANMLNVRIVKAAHDMSYDACFTDICQELISQSFALGGTFYEARNINKIYGSGNLLFWLEYTGHKIQALIRQFYHTHIGVNRTERIVFRLRRSFCERRKNGGLSHIRKSYDSTSQFHICVLIT